MRQSSLHPEFSELEGKVFYVVERVKGKEWSSNCPNCGGDPHQNGSLPDRFRMFVKSHSKHGITIGWCRACGYKWTPKTDYKPDPEKLEMWRKEQIEYHERRKAESEQALIHLRNEGKWQVYYEHLINTHRAQGYWIGSGLDDEYFWHYWGLGYDPQHEFWFDTANGWKLHVTETVTIPVRNLQGEIVNIKHRLFNPFEGVKYRMEYSTGIEPLCVANLDNLKCDFALIMEGEKKNYLAWKILDNLKVQAYGLPMTPSEEMLKSLPFKTAIYIPDPDAMQKRKSKNGKELEAPAKRIINTLKDRDLRVLQLHDKFDDWAILVDLQKNDFESLLKQARKV